MPRAHADSRRIITPLSNRKSVHTPYVIHFMPDGSTLHADDTDFGAWPPNYISQAPFQHLLRRAVAWQNATSRVRFSPLGAWSRDVAAQNRHYDFLDSLTDYHFRGFQNFNAATMRDAHVSSVTISPIPRQLDSHLIKPAAGLACTRFLNDAIYD